MSGPICQTMSEIHRYQNLFEEMSTAGCQLRCVDSRGLIVLPIDVQFWAHIFSPSLSDQFAI